MHAHKRATFTQREFGTDFDDFPTGLRSALRQAPKVILVGEMRDRATVEIALTAAETGHLVLSTLNTIGAGPSINRILGMFEVSEQPQLRLRFMEMLRYTVSQRLVPRLGGGRHLAQEIMGSNFRVREIIAHGESEERLFADAIESNSAAGWASFDQSLLQACAAGQIAEETALLYAAHKNKFARLLDLARKDEDKAPELSVGFRLDRAAVPKASALSGEIRLKL